MGSWVVPGYTEVRELGRGAAGRTALAWHDSTGTPVAIRYLHDTLRADHDHLRAFRVVAHRLTTIDNPHIVRHYEYAESAAGAAAVMELVDGATLRAILDDAGALHPLAAAIVLHDSLLGLAAAHAGGVRHGDYRPEHVLVDTEGRAKLIEFGVPGDDPAGERNSVRADLDAATATFRECLGAISTATAALRRLANPGTRAASADAQSLLAELAAAARVGYGPGWEGLGRDHIAERAARLLRVATPPGRPAADPAAAGAAVSATGPGRGDWPRSLLVGVAVALVVAAAFASLVAR